MLFLVSFSLLTEALFLVFADEQRTPGKESLLTGKVSFIFTYQHTHVDYSLHIRQYIYTRSCLQCWYIPLGRSRETGIRLRLRQINHYKLLVNYARFIQSSPNVTVSVITLCSKVSRPNAYSVS